MINNSITILSSEQHIIKNIKEHYRNTEVFDDYLKLIISVLIKKHYIIILDSPELPYFNEHRIIHLINSLCNNCAIIYINRETDINSLKRIYDNNYITYIMNYPINFTHLNSIIDHLLINRGNNYE